MSFSEKSEIKKYLRNGFPCINCITFPICKSLFVEKIKYNSTPYSDCRLVISITNLTLYYSLEGSLLGKCNILRNYLCNMKESHTTRYFRVAEITGSFLYKIFKINEIELFKGKYHSKIRE